MANRYLLGFDVGSSSVKASLVNADSGKCVATAFFPEKEAPIMAVKAGWAEQDPQMWWDNAKLSLKKIMVEAGATAEEIKAIGISYQMHGLVCVDKNLKALRPSIIWCDSRAVPYGEKAFKDLGADQCLSHLLNSPGNFTAAKLAWVKENEPENFKKIKKIMLPKDYLAYKLSGTFCTDYSDASGMLLLDVKNRKWSKEMCDICGITEDMLPKLFDSFEKVGELKHDLAAELGLRDGVVIAAGAGDNAAAAVGTGTVGNNKCNISLGTSGTIFMSSDSFAVDSNNALHSFDHADGHFHLMGCMLSAASCNKWWMDEILKTKDYADEQKGIDKLGENHVFFLPYLMGERSPWNNPNARATFTGITMDTTREDMTQAVLEGVAFATRDMYEVAKSIGVAPKRTMICGGGAKSPLWRRMIANILNVEVDVPSCEEGPGMGGAMLAMVACGAYKSVEEAAAAIVKVDKTEKPDPELVAKYEARYQQFKTIYPALAETFDKII